jgi:putative transposase
VLTGIDQAWVADITYIRILRGFVFLAALLDRYSRKVIGWAISKGIDAELCLAALKSALAKRQPPPGCIHHSDRGVQYACGEYVAILEAANMKISMSRTGNPYDSTCDTNVPLVILHSEFEASCPSFWGSEKRSLYFFSSP